MGMSLKISSAPEEKPEGTFHPHEISDAYDTLMKAEEIKSNPKMMKALKPHIAKKKKAITSIQDLRDRAKQAMAEEKAEGESASGKPANASY